MPSSFVYSNDLNDNESNDLLSFSDLPLREIPGSYGLPFLGAIRDRWDFFYVQGSDQFFRTRMEKYESTVFRVNMPPGPWISPDSRVIVLLDGKTFPILFDSNVVEKRDVLVGTYVPSSSFTGGYRVCPYLDPSEHKHGILKSLLLATLVSKHKEIIPMFQRCLEDMFRGLEDQLRDTDRAQFGPLIDVVSLEIFFRILCEDKSPSDTKLGSNGPNMIKKWAIFQIAPVQTFNLPKLLNPIEDFVLHSIGLPFFLVKNDYKRMYDVISSTGTSFLDKAETLGLNREEACHNLLFFVGFNSSIAVAKWFSSLMKWVASAGETLHHELAHEVRNLVKSDIEGGRCRTITINTINKMVLTKSVILEALRIDPPVPYQYGRAKRDIMIQSHDATFKIKKGEMMFGYQPFATKDPKIFHDPEKFIGNRFVGEEGKRLMKYVYWSNGREIDDPTPENKQCPGKNVVELLSMILLAEFFLRYDTFSIDSSNTTSLTFLSLKKNESYYY